MSDEFDLLENSKVVTFDIDAIIDGEFDFYGVHSNTFKVDEFVIIPLEDPDDGYRSYLDQYVLSLRPDTFVYPQTPLDRVHVKKVSNHQMQMIQIRSKVDNYLWLEIGTDHTDDYYPMCMFRYYPRDGGMVENNNERNNGMYEAKDFKET